MGVFRVTRFLKRNYRESVPIAYRPQPNQIPPVELPLGIEQYEGEWVAVFQGRVLASAPTDRELAHKLRELGPDGQEAVMRFVRPPMGGYVIGVG